MTNLFFDDNGSFKAGSVLSSTSATYQVELSTGKRTKVKGSKVFFSFEQPSPQAFMEKACWVSLCRNGDCGAGAGLPLCVTCCDETLS